MGKGIDLARQDNSAHAQALDDLKDQLLVVFLKALSARGHTLTFPLSEIDDTGSDLVAFSVDPVTKAFTFELRKKS